MAAPFPPLSHEPRAVSNNPAVAHMHLPVSKSASYLAQLQAHQPISGAPPPYCSKASSEEDNSSGLWSDSSYGSKKRSSWNNLIETEDLNKFRPANIFRAQAASSTCSAYSLPHKQPLVSYSAAPELSTPIGEYPRLNSRQQAYASQSSSVFSEVGKPQTYRPNFMSPPMGPLPAGSRPPSADVLQPISMPPPVAASRAKAQSSQQRRDSLNEKKRNRMEELRNCWAKPGSKLCCLATLIVLIALVVVAVVLTQVFQLPKRLQFQWLAPDLQRHGNTNPNQLVMQVADQQVRMELMGNMPFKSNYVSILDFRTNKVAIVDSALKSGGRNLVCFVMDLDRNGIRSLEHFQRAGRNAETKKAQTRGWEETWNFIATPMANGATNQFKPDVAECRGARWIELSYTSSYQKQLKCSDCYDFCLPEYGVEHDHIRDESYLNIIRRDCFYLYVPEWRNYAQGYNPQQPGQTIQPGQLGQPGQPNQPGQPIVPPVSQILNQPAQFGNTNPNGQFQNNANTPFNNQNGQFQNNQGQSGGGGGGGFGQNPPGGLQGAIGTIGSGVQQLGHAIADNPTVQRVGQQLETRWINLQGVPQQIQNASREAVQNIRANVNEWGQTIPQLINGPSNTNNGNNGNTGQQPPLTPSQLFNQQQQQNPDTVPPFPQPHQQGFPVQNPPPSFQENPLTRAHLQNGQFVPVPNPNPNLQPQGFGNNNNGQQLAGSVGQQWNIPTWPNANGPNGQPPQLSGQQTQTQPQFGSDLSSQRTQQQSSPQFNQGWVNVGSG